MAYGSVTKKIYEFLETFNTTVVVRIYKDLKA